MKNYSRRRAGKGKTAYRSPSRFIAQEAEALKRMKVFKKNIKFTTPKGEGFIEKPLG